MALPGGVFTGTPNVGFGRWGGGAQDWRVGWRLAAAVTGGAGFEMSLDATLREPVRDDQPPEQEVMLRGAVRW